MFYHIPFPSDKELKEIVEKRIRQKFPTDFVDGAVKHLFKIREENLRKRPGTAEFLAPSVKARIPDKYNAEPVQTTTTPSKWKYFILGILLLTNLVLFALARNDIRFAWESMTSPEVKNQPGEVKPLKPPDIRFLKNEQFYTAARLMRQRLESDVQIPDMDKTVKETIASAGFPKFCYKSLTKPPEYLILIDMPTHRDHYASLADQIAKALESEDIFVTRYFYENGPQICFEERTQERVYLSDLQTKFGDSRLIIFGNGEELLDPISGQPETWTEIFHIWQDKAILTPERPQRWGMREITLAEQFNCIGI